MQATITRNDFQTLSKHTISTPCAFLLDAFEQSDTLINIDDVTKKVVQNIDINCYHKTHMHIFSGIQPATLCRQRATLF